MPWKATKHQLAMDERMDKMQIKVMGYEAFGQKEQSSMDRTSLAHNVI